MVAQGPYLLPPTIRLPAISKIAFSSSDVLLEALHYLRLVYNPQVRGSRRIKKTALSIDLGVSAISKENLDFDVIRSDAYERTYAMRWLTALISHASAFEILDNELDMGLRFVDPTSALVASQYDTVLTAASSLLAICAGASAAGMVTRIFTFGLGGPDLGVINVTLNDAPLENQHFESVGAQTWGGACVLSELVAERPAAFGLFRGKGDRMRVLELGAGTGLVSLTTGKTLEAMGLKGEIIATDFYPSVLANLHSNVIANFPAPSKAISVSSCFLDWSTFPAVGSSPPPFDRTFDVVLGADIIYEPLHALWIKGCLQRLLRKPNLSSTQPAIFHLVIPMRPTHEIESRTIEAVFPMAAAMPASSSGEIELAILEREIIMCEAGDGCRGEEVEYEYYRIGWGSV